MSKFAVRRAAVLGAGTMGSRIAAHFANAGIPTYLLDVAPPPATGPAAQQSRNSVVEAGWKAALAGKPAALFSPELAALVKCGNYADDMPRLSEADWIVEAVAEDPDVKRALLKSIEPYRKPGAIVSSNTSGIPLGRIAEGFPEDFRAHFLGTHFFNPPRYLKLLEIIPTPDTAPEAIAFVTEFGSERLGKGVIRCKDTPGFIANRIGTHAAAVAIKLMVENGLTVEEVDALTGPVVGRAKSATCRTVDVVGLDTFARVAANLAEALRDDPEREMFNLPAFFLEMVSRGWLGDKTGQGFYKRVMAAGAPSFHHLDYTTMEYVPPAKPAIPVLENAGRIRDLPERLRKLTAGSGRYESYLWQVLSATLSYAASRVPEISDDIVSVDNALKWGFLYKLGPFQTWDALGVRHVARRMEREGRPVPPLVESLLNSGKASFYRTRSGKTWAFAPSRGSYERPQQPAGLIVLRSLNRRTAAVLHNESASLLDLGDGVACLEFHSKMNTIDALALELIHQGVERAERDFEGLVVGNEGENFSVGANLGEILGAASVGQWQEIDRAIASFQSATMKLRYSAIPVVAAPHQLALGGGCEIMLHCDQVHAAAELYAGLVETGVGLIPAAGGTKEMALRAAAEAGSNSELLLAQRVRTAFETVAMARVSGSAFEARNLGFLRPKDRIAMNADRRIAFAKRDALAMAAEGYRRPVPRTDIPVLGQPGFAALKLGLHLMKRAGYISDYDQVVGTHLARVLTGGDLPRTGRVSEQYLLELEREVFLSLCGQEKTRERMQYMLKTGKPLRN